MDLERVFKELHRYKADVQFTSKLNEKTQEVEDYYVVQVYSLVVSDYSLEGCVNQIKKRLEQREREEQREEQRYLRERRGRSVN